MLRAVEALPLLGCEPPFALLTINDLIVYFVEGGEQAFLNLASALSGHKGMEKLFIHTAPLGARATVDALLDAAISAGIKDACFGGCGLTPTALPALGRLLHSPGFASLKVWNGHQDAAIFESPSMPVFCEALRNSKSLRRLWLMGVNLWADIAAASQLIAAMEGLTALRELSIEGNCTDVTPETQRAAGECLARFIACSTSLRVLNLANNRLGDPGMTPIFQALGRNTCLEKLNFGLVNGEHISAEFAHDVVLPAVRATTRLRELNGLRWVDADDDADEEDDDEELLPELQEVEDILAARRRADEEAA